MGFYEQISKYYDNIFPIGEAQLSFIKESTESKEAIISNNKTFENEAKETGKNSLSKKKVLDVACGSGGYAISLAKEGYEVTAVDLDDEMVRLAKDKAKSEELDIDISKCDMKELQKLRIRDKKSNEKQPQEEKLFNCIYCIGNSLVHLGSFEDVGIAIGQMKDLLIENGVLILQIINYDRVIMLGENELPTITDKSISLEFVRKYEFNKANGLINFNTCLSVDNNGIKEKFENSIELLPLRSDQMFKLLNDCGFNKIEFYGDFNKAAYTISSQMLVIKASKRAI